MQITAFEKRCSSTGREMDWQFRQLLESLYVDFVLISFTTPDERRTSIIVTLLFGWNLSQLPPLYLSFGLNEPRIAVSNGCS